MPMTASGRSASLILLAVAVLLSVPGLSMGVVLVNEKASYDDPEGDVVVDDGVAPMETLSDLGALPDRRAPESKERLSLDIRSLTVLENDTYISFVLEMVGPVYARSEYHYLIAGYAREVVADTDPFDFMIDFNNKTARYLEWRQGDFAEIGNASFVDVRANSLNITMHRAKFILDDRDTPRLVIGIAYLHQGGTAERISDHLVADEGADGGGFKLTDAQWLGFQIGITVLVILSLFVIYGIWQRKKGEALTGGVCPKCESRLDPNINFCPSCGTMVRGPGSDRAPEPEDRSRKPPIEE
jgi:hypothetical protein